MPQTLLLLGAVGLCCRFHWSVYSKVESVLLDGAQGGQKSQQTRRLKKALGQLILVYAGSIASLSGVMVARRSPVILVAVDALMRK